MDINIDNISGNLEKFFNNDDIPEKIEIGSLPIFEKVYKNYMYKENVLLPDKAQGIDFLMSKILNVRIKYILMGLVAFKAYQYYNKR